MRGEGELEREWLDQIVGLNDVKTAYVFLGMPGGQTKLELIKYYRHQMNVVFSNFMQILWVSDILRLLLTILKLLLPN